jgi:hypothetical protein
MLGNWSSSDRILVVWVVCSFVVEICFGLPPGMFT